MEFWILRQRLGSKKKAPLLALLVVFPADIWQVPGRQRRSSVTSCSLEQSRNRMEPPLGTQQGAMQPLVVGDFEACLLDKVDQRRQWVSQMVDEVQKVIYHLTTEISNQDIRFQAIPYSLMYNGNITVLSPSQFLVTVPVRGLSGYREAREQRWRYYTLQGARLTCPQRSPEGLQQWLEVQQFMKNLWQWHKADVSIEGDIVPAKVLQVFRKLVENAIETCHLSGKVSMLTTGITVHVAMETSEGQVEIELAPEVEIPTAWSKRAPWPRCLSRWPSSDRAKCVKSFGFSLLARWHYHWQLSFLQAERVLLEHLDEDGGCRRRCFQALRQMKEDVWCPGQRPVITSHHLQTVLFWTCEKYPHAKDWQVFSKGLLRLARKLHKCVRQRFLKHFFVRSGNLLQHAASAELDTVAQKLALFLKDPGSFCGLLTFHSGSSSVDGCRHVPGSCPGEQHRVAKGVMLISSTSEA